MRFCRVKLSSAVFCLLPLLSLTTTGCFHQINVGAPALPETLKGKEYALANYKADVANYDTIMNAKSVDLSAAKILRDKISYALMTEIDAVYGEYTKRLFAGQGSQAVLFDSAVLGLTSAATIATHAPTKTILAALGTAVTGVSLSIDKNFYAQQTFQVIAIAMQTRRDAARQALVTNLSSLDAVTYPLDRAKRDLIAYYYAGTLAGGLQEIQQEAGKASVLQTANATTPTAPTPAPAPAAPTPAPAPAAPTPAPAAPTPAPA